MEDESRINDIANHEKPGQPCPPTEEAMSNLAESQIHESPDVGIETTEVSQEKQVEFDEQTGKITASTVPSRKDSIPDFAPPPYSISTNGTATEPGDEVQVAPVSEAPPQKWPEEAEDVNTPSEGKQKSFLTQLYSGR